jgi:predicted deacylase
MVALGERITRGQKVATIYDPFGRRLGTISARVGGLIIGHTQRPLVNRGDAILHVAELSTSGSTEELTDGVPAVHKRS